MLMYYEHVCLNLRSTKHDDNKLTPQAKLMLKEL